MNVGAGKSEICFPDHFFPTEGFTKVDTPLYARVALLQDNMDIAIVSIEVTSLPPEEIAEIKRMIREETGVKEENCWVCVSHTFSAPHILPEAIPEEARQKRRGLIESIHRALREAARMASISAVEARLTFGSSECAVNVNRDFETPYGWWVSNCGTGPSNQTMSIIRAVTEFGDSVLFLVHYAVQSSVMDGSTLADGGKIVSGDLAGIMSSSLEQQFPGAVVLFLMGAAGDQAPVEKAKTVSFGEHGEWVEHDMHEAGIPRCRALGLQAADSVKQASDSAVPMETRMGKLSVTFEVPAKQMNRNLRELRPTRSYSYVPDGYREVTIEALQIGTVVFLGVKPELNCVTAQQIMDYSPFKRTLVTTMVNGGEKYMADEQSYDRFTYEAMNSPFGKGAAEKLCEQAITLLNQLYRKMGG